MKNPIKNVTLSFSCPEKLENMEDVGNNKYCRNCQHLVIDFTKLTQDEYDEAVKNAPGRVCGMFKSPQMSPRFLKYAAAASALSMSVFAPTSCAPEDPIQKQVEPPVEQVIEENEPVYAGIIFTTDSIQVADTTAMP